MIQKHATPFYFRMKGHAILDQNITPWNIDNQGWAYKVAVQRSTN